MKLTTKQITVYTKLGCKTVSDIKALKRMIKSILDDDRRGL